MGGGPKGSRHWGGGGGGGLRPRLDPFAGIGFPRFLTVPTNPASRMNSTNPEIKPLIKPYRPEAHANPMNPINFTEGTLRFVSGFGFWCDSRPRQYEVVLGLGLGFGFLRLWVLGENLKPQTLKTPSSAFMASVSAYLPGDEMLASGGMQEFGTLPKGPCTSYLGTVGSPSTS